METSGLIVTLSIVTLLAVLAIAWISKRRTDKRKHDPQAPKSTLAEDAPNTRREAS